MHEKIQRIGTNLANAWQYLSTQAVNIISQPANTRLLLNIGYTILITVCLLFFSPQLTSLAAIPELTFIATISTLIFLVNLFLGLVLQAFGFLCRQLPPFLLNKLDQLIPIATVIALAITIVTKAMIAQAFIKLTLLFLVIVTYFFDVKKIIADMSFSHYITPCFVGTLLPLFMPISIINIAIATTGMYLVFEAIAIHYATPSLSLSKKLKLLIFGQTSKSLKSNMTTTILLNPEEANESMLQAQYLKAMKILNTNNVQKEVIYHRIYSYIAPFIACARTIPVITVSSKSGVVLLKEDHNNPSPPTSTKPSIDSLLSWCCCIINF